MIPTQSKQERLQLFATSLTLCHSEVQEVQVSKRLNRTFESGGYAVHDVQGTDSKILIDEAGKGKAACSCSENGIEKKVDASGVGEWSWRCQRQEAVQNHLKGTVGSLDIEKFEMLTSGCEKTTIPLKFQDKFFEKKFVEERGKCDQERPKKWGSYTGGQEYDEEKCLQSVEKGSIGWWDLNIWGQGWQGYIKPVTDSGLYCPGYLETPELKKDKLRFKYEKEPGYIEKMNEKYSSENSPMIRREMIGPELVNGKIFKNTSELQEGRYGNASVRVETVNSNNYQRDSELMIIEPQGEKYETTLIFFHGAQQHMTDLERLQVRWVNYFKGLRVVLPQQQKVKIQKNPCSMVNKKFSASEGQWYNVNLKTLSPEFYKFDRDDNEEVMPLLNKNKEAYYEQIVKRFVEEDLSKKVLFAGFSQGCAMAFQTQMEATKELVKVGEKPPIGLIMFGGVPFGKQEIFQGPHQEVARNIPFLHCHGKNDQTITCATQAICDAGVRETYKMQNYTGICFDVAHDISKDVLAVAEKWLVEEKILEILEQRSEQGSSEPQQKEEDLQNEVEQDPKNEVQKDPVTEVQQDADADADATEEAGSEKDQAPQVDVEGTLRRTKAKMRIANLFVSRARTVQDEFALSYGLLRHFERVINNTEKLCLHVEKQLKQPIDPEDPEANSKRAVTLTPKIGLLEFRSRLLDAEVKWLGQYDRLVESKQEVVAKCDHVEKVLRRVRKNFVERKNFVVSKSNPDQQLQSRFSRIESDIENVAVSVEDVREQVKSPKLKQDVETSGQALKGWMGTISIQSKEESEAEWEKEFGWMKETEENFMTYRYDKLSEGQGMMRQRSYIQDNSTSIGLAYKNLSRLQQDIVAWSRELRNEVDL